MPCCSASAAMASQDDGLAVQVVVAPLVARPHPQFTAAPLEGIFHPGESVEVDHPEGAEGLEFTPVKEMEPETADAKS